MKTLHILFAGGGTAGHINPAIAVATHIKNLHSNAKISFIGNSSGMEAKLAPLSGFDFYGINVAGFQRKVTPKNIARNMSAAVKVFTSSAEAKKWLKELKPDVVVGTGGYVSGPVVRQAYKLNIPTIIQEQNALPGVTTKILAQKVDAVLLAMPDATKHLKCKHPPIITGNPVRAEVIDQTKEAARKALGITDEKPIILSMGGSLGAHKINKAMVGVVSQHAKLEKYHHYHSAGRYGIKWFSQDCKENGANLEKFNHIHVSEYINNMADVMNAADLIISRAGAITLSEIRACGKASILIPSPNVAENHQFHNALALAKQGAAVVIEEADLTPNLLANKVLEILDNNEKRLAMEQASKDGAILNSNEKIYKVIIGLIKSKDNSPPPKLKDYY